MVTSEQIMTSKEYTAWLEVSLATAVDTIDKLLMQNQRLITWNQQLVKEGNLEDKIMFLNPNIEWKVKQV